MKWQILMDFTHRLRGLNNLRFREPCAASETAERVPQAENCPLAGLGRVDKSVDAGIVN
jgi:hypothetical protein